MSRNRSLFLVRNDIIRDVDNAISFLVNNTEHFPQVYICNRGSLCHDPIFICHRRVPIKSTPSCPVIWTLTTTTIKTANPKKHSKSQPSTLHHEFERLLPINTLITLKFFNQHLPNIVGIITY